MKVAREIIVISLLGLPIQANAQQDADARAEQCGTNAIQCSNNCTAKFPPRYENWFNVNGDAQSACQRQCVAQIEPCTHEAYRSSSTIQPSPQGPNTVSGAMSGSASDLGQCQLGPRCNKANQRSEAYVAQLQSGNGMRSNAMAAFCAYMVGAEVNRVCAEELQRTAASCTEVEEPIGSGAVSAARVPSPCRTRPMPAAVIISLGRSGA